MCHIYLKWVHTKDRILVRFYKSIAADTADVIDALSRTQVDEIVVVLLMMS